jgi:hypothetical protein
MPYKAFCVFLDGSQCKHSLVLVRQSCQPKQDDTRAKTLLAHDHFAEIFVCCQQQPAFAIRLL